MVRLYRAEAANGSITVAAGDSVGATPPISAFFGDTPTHRDHEPDGLLGRRAGQPQLRQGLRRTCGTLIAPMAKFPYVSANLVDAAGKTPAEWSPSTVFGGTFGGTKLGMIGFSNDDLTSLIFPGDLDPFHVIDSATAVNAEAAKLAGKNKSGPIVAMGHLGATAGTISNPTGPLIDFADKLSNVDVVIGDHTDFQVEHGCGRTACSSWRTGARASASCASGSWSTRVEAGRLQDRRLPQAVGHRRHARPGHPGADRRAERPDRADPGRRGRLLRGCDPARRRVRRPATGGRASR